MIGYGFEPLDDEGHAADVETNARALETGICPSCEQEIPDDRLEIHLAGLDGARPECPRQDLVEIAERARAAESTQALWGRRPLRRLVDQDYRNIRW
jgi:hypothetical protein